MKEKELLQSLLDENRELKHDVAQLKKKCNHQGRI